MGEPLRVLIVEDSEADTELLVRELKRADYDVTFERVDTPEFMAAELECGTWDLVISDYTMPHFRGTAALELVKKAGLDVPFIFLSGTIGEEIAVAAMKAGAQDYVMKGSLQRLIPAVERELREATVRRERRRAEEELQRRQNHIQALHDINLAITSTLDLRQILEALLAKVSFLFAYPVATELWLFGGRDGELEVLASRSPGPKDLTEPHRGGESLANLVCQRRSPLLIRNIHLDPRVKETAFLREGLVTYLGVPLIAKDLVVGVLSLYAQGEQEFTQEEIEFLCTLAGQAAVAIQNAQLYNQTRQQAVELEKANKTKAEFLSVMSHELRTPLSAIMGYTDVVLNKILGGINQEQEAALGKVISRSHDLSTIINAILQATRLEAGGVQLEVKEVNLNDFLDDLKSVYDFPLDKEIVLKWDYDTALPVAKTDPDKLKHVLENLIHNAIKFTPKGTVAISARVVEENEKQTPERQAILEFSVSDTGVGIPEDKLGTIFEIFRQVDSSKTRSHGGVGIGLYVVKQFTHLLGGSVTVQSELGKGSTFVVSLPLVS